MSYERYSSRGWIRIVLAMSLMAGLAACSPGDRVMSRSLDYSFPGDHGDGAHYKDEHAAWTREATLGVRGNVQVTLLDPKLEADRLAFMAKKQGRKVSLGYDGVIWQGLYGMRSDRLPFDITWRFDKMFQPQRVTNPHVNWTFRLEDDHGRSWAPLYIGHLSQRSGHDDWIGSFRLWFPTQDVLKGPLFDGRTGKVTLQISGPPGEADFDWKFRPDIGPPSGV